MNIENCLTASEARARRFLHPWVYLFAAMAVYGLANYLSGMKYLPGCSFAELRPQVCLPIFMGLYFGPLAGFLVGAGGDSMGYVLAGTNPFSLWHWTLANGLMGAIPGLSRKLGFRRVMTLHDMQGIYMLLFLATSLPFAFAAGIEYLQGNLAFKEAFFLLFLPIFVTDAIFAIIFIPLAMLLARLLVITIAIAIFLLTTYLASLVAVGTFVVSLIAIWGSQALAEMTPGDLYAVGVLTLLVSIAGFLVAGVFVRRVTSPIQTLAQVAEHVANERYDQLEALNCLQQRSDELGRLAKTFMIMLNVVRCRETRLKEEVRQLHIEIDSVRQAREVRRITGSDYFKKLKTRANELRLKDTP